MNHNTRIAISRLIGGIILILAVVVCSPPTGWPQVTPITSNPRGVGGTGYPSGTGTYNNSMGNTGTYPGTAGTGSSAFGSRSRDREQEGGSRSRREKKRDKAKSEEKARNSKKDTKKKTGNAPQSVVAGAPGRAAPQGVSAIPGGGKGGKKGSLTPAELPLPIYKLSPLIQSSTIYFSPAEIKVPPGGKFSSPIFFYNAGGHKVDRLDVWIHYPPDLLQPDWINLDPIKELAEGGVQRDVYRSRGYVRIRANLSAPLTKLLQPLSTINWSGAATPARTEITFAAPPGESFGIYAGEVNCLDNPQIINQGKVPLAVSLAGDGPETYADERPMRMLAAGEDPTAPVPRGNEGVHLALVPKQDHVRTGEVSTLDIAIVNPNLVPFDELRLRLRFDPNAVEILDADEDNYITRGVNIYDGGFHSTMPFDRHIANAADIERGTIDYAVGNGVGSYPYPSGSIARVVFRMKKESEGSAFWFEGLNSQTGGMISDVRTRGRSVLGESGGNPVEALHNVRIVAARIE